MKKVHLREICHARSGDKGFHANIGLIVYDRRHFELIRQQVTAERVKELFHDSVKGRGETVRTPEWARSTLWLRDSLDGRGNTHAFPGWLRQGPQFSPS